MASETKVLRGQDPVLLPPRDEAYVLHGVYERVTYGCREMLLLDCGDGYLQIRVDENTDSLDAEYYETKLKRNRGHRSLGSVAPWDGWIGKAWGWTWVAVNQQGYWDTILLSFEGIVPNVLLQGMASSIMVLAVSPVER